MSHLLTRRALEVAQEHFSSPGGFGTVNPADEPQNDPNVKIAIWGVVLLSVTGILYAAMMSAISYTYGDVIATLAMIETPTASAFTISEDVVEETEGPVLSEEQKSEKMKLIESDLFLIKQKPITSKMRTAVKHLTARGGFLARFRGLHVSILYHALHSLIVFIFAGSNKYAPLRPLVAVVASVALCRLQMLWTHIVISAPNNKRWWRRIPSVKAGKNIIVPTAVLAIAVEAAVYVPRVLLRNVQETLVNPSAYGSNPETVQKIALVEMAFIVLLAVGTIFLIVIPADATLKRVQASLLPEEDETIVPFDRTFAGKVKPEILGGSGAVSMLDAWKTFDRSARIRLVKLYAKVFVVQFMITLMFIFVFVGELRLIFGDDLAKAGRLAQSNLKGRN